MRALFYKNPILWEPYYGVSYRLNTYRIYTYRYLDKYTWYRYLWSKCKWDTAATGHCLIRCTILYIYISYIPYCIYTYDACTSRANASETQQQPDAPWFTALFRRRRISYSRADPYYIYTYYTYLYVYIHVIQVPLEQTQLTHSSNPTLLDLLPNMIYILIIHTYIYIYIRHRYPWSKHEWRTAATRQCLIYYPIQTKTQ